MSVQFSSFSLLDYSKAMENMRYAQQEIIQGSTINQIWFLEHPSIYTAGTSAKESDLINPLFPVYQSGRGGQYTYHGPGQLITYLMIKLEKRDIRLYIKTLAQCMIDVLNDYMLDAFFDPNHVGIWINTPLGVKKIAAIGIRLSKWVTSHGFALNINPDLSHYSGIIPCGIKEFGVTSLHEVGVFATRDEIEKKLERSLQNLLLL